jgi:predicted NBD/HSP70 family sugar kinase
VLRTLEEKGPISRAALARETHMSTPTVHSIVAHFLAKGVITELGAGKSTGGRRPILLELNPNAGYVVGVAISGSSVKVCTSNLRESLICQHSTSAKKLGRGKEAITGIAETVEKVIEMSDLPKDKVLSVGVAVPGIIDPISGELSLAPQLGWNQIPVGRLLFEKLNIPVYVERNVSAAAFAELQCGVGKDGVRDFVFISISEGIGASIVMDGELYRGSLGAAGEIGYMITDLGWFGARDVTGFGCLETFGDNRALTEALAVDTSKGLMAGDEVDSPALVSVAKGQTSNTLENVRQTADHLAAALTNIAVLLNPGALVIGGDILEIPVLAEFVLNCIDERLKQVSPIRPQLLFSKVRGNTELVGAVSKACLSVKNNNLLF